MFREPHAAGYVDPSGYPICETLLIGPMISPHLFPGQFTANDPLDDGR